MADETLVVAWGSYFPADCPPESATEANGSAYRFVRNDPPTDADFVPYKKAGKAFLGDDCQACALSVLRDFEDVQYMQSAIPGFRTRHVAVGNLSAGVILNTPGRGTPSHHSWWLPDGTVVSAGFRVLAAGDRT